MKLKISFGVILFFLISKTLFAQTDYEKLQKDFLAEKYQSILDTPSRENTKEGRVFILTYKAYSALNLNKLNQAEDFLNQLEKIDKNNSSIHHLKAYVFLKENSQEKVETELQTLFNKNDLNKDEKLVLLNIYMQKHDFSKATELIETFSQKEKSSPQVLQILGYLDFIHHNYKNSLYHYKRAIALKSYRPENYLALESIYGQLKLNASLISSLKEGLEKNPNDFFLLSHLAYQLEVNHQKNEALNVYKKALVVSSEKDRPYIKTAIKRLASMSRFNSHTKYLVSNDQFVSSNQDFQNSGIEARSFQQSFEGRYNENVKFGLDVISNTQIKELAGTDHKIKDGHYSIRMNYENEVFLVNISIGQILYDINDIGSGTSGKSDEIIRNSLISYKLKNNIITLSHNRKWDIDDLGTALKIQKLDVFALQDSHSFNDIISLTGRVQYSVADTFKVTQLTLTPVFYIRSVIGLSMYFSFDNYDYKNSQDFLQYSLGTNYDKSWSDSFSSSLTLNIGRRELASTNFIQLNTMFNYYLSDFHSLTWEIGGIQSDSNDGENTSLSSSLALNLNF